MSKTFRTEIQFVPPTQKIKLHSQIFSIGSCFSENIGQLLQKNKFNVMVNPFGIVFNPISSIHLLQHALLDQPLSDDKIIQNHGMYYHYDLHSDITSADKLLLSKQVSEKLAAAGEYLQKSDVLLFTMGTAFIYRLLENKEVVSNCHKMPARFFKKELLTPEQIILAFNEMHKMLPHDINIVLTVSPVRHKKDTLPLNSVSKSVLRLAAYHLSEQHANVHYFPAYEMLLDDLRDYRFYKDDLLHPNTMAIQYIWEHFYKACINQEGIDFIHKWEKISKALSHRPFNPATEEHRHFLVNTLDRLREIKTIDVSNEMKILKDQLQLFAM